MAPERQKLTRKRVRSSNGCRQCKLRKVKCDENPGACHNCTRLGFTCTFDAGAGTTSDSNADRPDEPLPKKRTKQACRLCRTNKLRCSGNQPKCQRCITNELECVYEQVEPAVSNPDVANHSENEDVMNNRWIAESEAAWSGAAVDERKVILQQHVDAFFQYVYTTGPYNFIHKGAFLRAWHNGVMDPNLLRIVTGIASRFIGNDSQDAHKVRPGAEWVDQVEREVLQNIETISIPRLQAMLLLVFDRSAAGRLASVWHLLALAARLAYALGFNHPTDAVRSLNQECRRRLMWCTYTLDKIFGGGLSCPSVCPRGSVHQSLPCNDRVFSLELKCETGSLEDLAAGNLNQTDGLCATAYLIRILDLRDQIQTYLREKSMNDIHDGSWQGGGRIDSFRQQLLDFKRLLPLDMQDLERTMYLRIGTSDMTVYIMVHTWLQTTACELSGSVLGITSNINKNSPNDGMDQQDLLSRAPTDLLHSCQTSLAEHAIALNRFWARVYHVYRHYSRFFVTDVTIGLCVSLNTRCLIYLARKDLLSSAEVSIESALRLNLEILFSLSKGSPYVNSWLRQALDDISESQHQNVAEDFKQSYQRVLDQPTSPLSPEAVFTDARQREDARFPNPHRRGQQDRTGNIGIDLAAGSVDSSRTVDTAHRFSGGWTAPSDSIQDLYFPADQGIEYSPSMDFMCLYGTEGGVLGQASLFDQLDRLGMPGT